MSLSLHQQNIINPYPGKTGLIPDGDGYDFKSARSQWVIAGIHDSYINYGVFPDVNLSLRITGPINEENKILTQGDLVAYLALYPQNGKLNF